MVATATKLAGSMARPRKQLSAREVRSKGEFGAFAKHLEALLAERGWDHRELARRCQAARLPIEEHAVRAWLRAENMPKSHLMRPLAKVLRLDDRRHILPPG